MKRKCKNVDITDLGFICTAINDCLRNKNKSRNDILRFERDYPNMSTMALEMQEEIKNRKLNLKPIWYKDKFDQASLPQIQCLSFNKKSKEGDIT